MSDTDRCARCGGDCPFIPGCKICGGCEEVACPHHYPEPDMGPVWDGGDEDDDRTCTFCGEWGCDGSGYNCADEHYQTYNAQGPGISGTRS